MQRRILISILALSGNILCCQGLLADKSSVQPGSLPDYTDIFDASKNGDLEKVKELLKDDPDLAHCKDERSLTPLHFAAFFGHRDVAEVLLANKADVNAESAGNTPLHYAALAGREEVAEILLAKKADVNAKNAQGASPLHAATVSGRKDVLELLLTKNADPNVADRDGNTPLRWAMSFGDFGKDAAVLLRKHGGLDPAADQNPPPQPDDDQGARTIKRWIDGFCLDSFVQNLHLAEVKRLTGEIRAADEKVERKERLTLSRDLDAAVAVSRGDPNRLDAIDIILSFEQLGDGSDARFALPSLVRALGSDVECPMPGLAVEARMPAYRLTMRAAAAWVIRKNGWETDAVALLKHDPELLLRSYRGVIELGAGQRELVELLLANGTEAIATDFLNSGNPSLAAAAQKWAKEHGYVIGRTGADAIIPKWGGQR